LNLEKLYFFARYLPKTIVFVVISLLGSYEDSDEEDFPNEWSGSPSSASPATMAMYSYDRSRTTNNNPINFGNYVTTPKKNNNNKPTHDEDDDSGTVHFHIIQQNQDIVAPLIPKVLEIVGGEFTNNEVAESLRKHNYDVNRTVSALLDASPSPQKNTRNTNMLP
jgi:hypothetical protein